VGKAMIPERTRTLMQAHEELVRTRPSQDASLAAWLKYYQHSVSLYVQISEIDPGHGLEALYWARREQRRAEQITARIRAEQPRK
jgi:hypothetical protein